MALVLFFVALGGIPLALGLMVPPRWTPAATLLVLYSFVWLWIEEVRADCAICQRGMVPGLGFSMVSFATAGALVGLGVRFAWQKFRPRPLRESSPSKTASQTALGLVAAGLAFVATTSTVWFSNALFDSAWTTHLLVLLLAGCWFWVFRLLDASIAFRWAGMLTVLLLIGWSVKVSSDVVSAAEKVAAGKPYCMLASTGHGPREPRTYLELSGFMMQADRGSSRHAYVAIDDERNQISMYWSYRSQTFKPDSPSAVLLCEPVLRYSDTLTVWRSEAGSGSGSPRFWLADGRWQIPIEHGGIGLNTPPRLTFYAHGKEFSAPPAGWVESKRRNSVNDRALVSIQLCTRAKLDALEVERDTDHQFGRARQDHGLERVAVSGRSGPGMAFQYAKYDDADRTVAMMQCDVDGRVCRHVFRRDGAIVEFSHPDEVSLAHWRELEQAVWRRIRSFAIVWPKSLQSCS